MNTKIIIIGGGIGGTIVANGLCKTLGSELNRNEVSLSMLSASDLHFYQPGLFYLPFGKFRESDLYKNQKNILDNRVDLTVDPVIKINVDENSLVTESGKTHDYISRLLKQRKPKSISIVCIGIKEESKQISLAKIYSMFSFSKEWVEGYGIGDPQNSVNKFLIDVKNLS